jgi:putative hydrolase of the HAD superfamily
MVKAVLLDMDNTLIETQTLYSEGKAALGRLVMGFGPFTPEEVLAYVERRQIELFPLYGYKAELLPTAFADTLLYFVKDARPAEIEEARTIALNVYARDAEVKQGVESALRMLSAHFEIHLLTAGDHAVQRRRIEALPFKHVFRKTFVVPEKDRATFRAVLKDIGCRPHEAVMIGDSLKSDIVPAVKVGMYAIHIESNNWHGLEMHGHSLPKERARRHESLHEAAIALVKKHGRKKPLPFPRAKRGGPKAA